MQRRDFFKYSLTAVSGLILLPILGRTEEKRRGKKAGADTTGSMPLVDENSSQAKGLFYKHDAKQVKDKAQMIERNGVPFAKQNCANCALYTGKAGEAQGGCSIFPGQAVKATGWCSTWNKKG